MCPTWTAAWKKWADEEDKVLVNAVHHYGTTIWATVAKSPLLAKQNATAAKCKASYRFLRERFAGKNDAPPAKGAISSPAPLPDSTQEKTGEQICTILFLLHYNILLFSTDNG